MARPTTPTGYRAVALRDVGPSGIADLNVELTANIASTRTDERCDVVMLGTLNGAPTMTYDPAAPMAGVEALKNMMGNGDTVTLTIPRARAAEVTGLRMFDRVRVRGYMSRWVADGCSWRSETADRYLWIDSIERVAPP